MYIPHIRQLPKRILYAVRQQQAESERVIAWVEIVIVLLFILLYSSSPKTFTRQHSIFNLSEWQNGCCSLWELIQSEPVPWALGVYLIFSAIRLILVYRLPSRNWHAYLAIFMDFMLLYSLIWSFHIQYMQPAAFYLKAPTMLYVFIFIAIRALRFERRFVLFSGLCAAVGWFLLMLYALYHDPTQNLMTRNYVEYLTSNTILVGAELDKIITIGCVTLILAIAIGRGRHLLIEAVFESSTVEDLSRFVPETVVKNISTSEERLQAGNGEVKEATLLFTDIEGFTSLSEHLPPEQLIQVLNDYFSIIAEPIKRYGGTINQFQGDAILASFNIPITADNHAANAINTALAIPEKLTISETTLRTRIGINTGRVVGGLVGTAERLTYTVHGEAVNLAARLEALNKDYGTRLLITESTRQAAGEETFEYQRVDKIKARGLTHSTEIYTVKRKQTS
ncbi:adenylate/guanylate cyclase domain-containing protein [Zooshikella sp. RANM57]|uniref:adenylate/guanylate cyclase domain-containing protein n=1 Tax=Zooshikella sp. RANM57 TaxID=3425863 RepID=UPI003D6DC91C